MGITSDNFQKIISSIGPGAMDEDKVKEILASMSRDDYNIMINYFEESNVEGFDPEIKKQTIELLKSIRSQFDI